MTPQQLTEFKARCLAARMYGRKIANAEAYAAALESEAGPVSVPAGAAKHSPDHLMALIDKVERVRSGEEKAESKMESKPSMPEAKPKSESKKEKKSKKSKKDDSDDDLMSDDLMSDDMNDHEDD